MMLRGEGRDADNDGGDGDGELLEPGGIFCTLYFVVFLDEASGRTTSRGFDTLSI